MNQTTLSGEELVFGLDIGTRNIVGTVGYRRGERFVIAAQEIRQHQTRAMLDGQIHDINRVASIISDIKRSLEDKLGSTLEEVCIAAAGRVLKTMNIHVDLELDKERNITKDDMNALISMGIEQSFAAFQEENETELRFYCVGYSVVRYYINGLWMSQPEHHKAKNVGADMIVTFLPDDVVDGLYSAVELAGLKVANLTLEPIAAIRVAIPEKYRLLNIAMIDVGAGTSDISITDDGSVVAFGMLPSAGDSLTELLARSCLIDFATAEYIKTQALTNDEIVYEDIMGVQQTIMAEEVLAICQPEIDRMSKLMADTIRDLNGGVSPSAVFIVGGGGKIRGFAERIAEELSIDPKRVAVRGEEIMRDVDFPDGALKDSTIITPVGICLTYYEQYNNFIYITFNGSRVKLYDNNKLTVMDAAIQAAFTHEGLFPRRGEDLHYTVNGKNRVTKGEYGESAHVYINGQEVSLSSTIKSNDEIVLEASTLGEPGRQMISDLIDYNGRITLNVNGDEMQLPKPVRVNGAVASDEYMIQEGDVIELAAAYTRDAFFEYMGLSAEDALLYINGEKAGADREISSSDKLEIKSRREVELKEIYLAAQEEIRKEASSRENARTRGTRSSSRRHRAEKEKAEKVENGQAVAGAAEDGTAGQQAVAQEDAAGQGASSEESALAGGNAASEESAVTGENAAAAGEDTAAAEPAAEQAAEEPAAGVAQESAAGINSAEDTAAESTDAGTDALTGQQAEVQADTTPEQAAESAPKAERAHEEPRQEQDTAHVFKNMKEDVAKEEKKEERAEPVEETGKKIIVIVNQKPIVMKGKDSYTFVDIFDYIDFDTRKVQGRGIATLVNGKDAQYTQTLYNGDKVEVYWKK